MPRSGFYNPGNYPVQTADMLGYALNSLVAEIVAGDTLSPMMSPLLAALRKATTGLDVIRWQYRVKDRQGKVDPLEAAALPSNFPLGDNGDYALSSVFPLELTIGGTKIWDVIKITSDEVRVALASGSTEEVRNLFSTRYEVALSGLIETLNRHLVYGKTSTISTSPIQGFESIFEATQYAGLVHTLTDYTSATDGVDYHLQWRPVKGVWEQSTASLSFNDGAGSSAATEYLLPQTSNGIVSAFQFFDKYLRSKNKTYNLIATTPDVAFAYSKAYEMRTDITVVNGQMTRAEGGFGNPAFRGMPIVEDNSIPANTVYFLDTRKIQFLTAGTSAVSQGSRLAPFAGMAFSTGPLATDTITVERYELLTVPQLLVTDTSGVSKLVLDPVDIYSDDVPLSPTP